MKKLILTFALAIGVTTFAQQGHSKNAKAPMEQMTPEQRQQKRLQKLTKELNLNAEQQKQVGNLLSKNGAKMRDLMAQQEALRNQMKTEMKNHDSEMKSVLTPEQYQKWQTMKEETKEKIKKKRGQGNR